MESTWRSIFSASNLIIAKGAPIFVVIFAATTQVLAWIGAITLSTTQQVAIWLVVAGLLVLFSIAHMACRAFATVKRHEVSVVWPQGQPMSQEPQGQPTPQELRGQPTSQELRGQPTSQELRGQPTSQEETSPPISSDEPGKPDERRTLRPVPPSGDGNPGDGSRQAVNMADVFPHGCYLVQGSISDVEECDGSVETSVVVDRLTGKRVFSCKVMDVEEGQPRPTEVKVVVDRMPDLPPPANGSPFTAIQFEGLTAAGPPTINRGRAEYTSLRATGIRPIRPAPAQSTEQKTG